MRTLQISFEFEAAKKVYYDTNSQYFWSQLCATSIHEDRSSCMSKTFLSVGRLKSLDKLLKITNVELAFILQLRVLIFLIHTQIESF